jgi:hypothetical protein
MGRTEDEVTAREAALITQALVRAEEASVVATQLPNADIYTVYPDGGATIVRLENGVPVDVTVREQGLNFNK